MNNIFNSFITYLFYLKFRLSFYFDVSKFNFIDKKKYYYKNYTLIFEFYNFNTRDNLSDFYLIINVYNDKYYKLDINTQPTNVIYLVNYSLTVYNFADYIKKIDDMISSLITL